jgi:cell pole-organizing protein PopZ
VDPNVKVDEILANIRKSIDSDIETLGGAAPTQQRGAMMRDALRDMRQALAVETEAKAPARPADLSDLRSRIRQKLEALEDQVPITRQPVAPEPQHRSEVVPTHKAFTGILSGPSLRGPTPLRPSFADSAAEDDLHYITPEQPLEQDWSEDPYTYAQGGEEPAQPQDPYALHYGYEQPDYGHNYAESLPGPLMSPHTEAHAETAFRQLSDTILARATGDRSLEDMTREMLKTMLKQWLDANLPTIVEELVREEIQRVARRGR